MIAATVCGVVAQVASEAVKTGWPPGLLQDDERKLSRWFAGRPGARRLAEIRSAEIENDRLAEGWDD